MRNLSKLSLIAGALALGAAFAPLTFAVAADMPPSPPPYQGQIQPPPPAYYPPPPPVAYAPPPPPPVYYAAAVPAYAVWPGPYYYGPYWGGYGPRWGYGRWGHWHR